MRTDRQTDMTNLTVTFHNFANSSRKERKNTHCRKNVEDVNAKDTGTYSNFCTVKC